MYRQNTIHHGEDFVISPLEFSFKYAFFQRSSHMKCLPSPVDAWSRVRNRLEQQVMDGMRVILSPWLPRWDDDNGWTTEEYLWCDQAKWVWTKNKWKSSFKLYWRPHVQSYILLKTPSKLNLWFQRYGHFKCCSEQWIQRKLKAIIRCIWKSILASSDSFSLITTHFQKEVRQGSCNISGSSELMGGTSSDKKGWKDRFP